MIEGQLREPISHSIFYVQLKRIKFGLSELDAGKFLVLHGMPGSGKTVLAAEAIRDPEITLRVRRMELAEDSLSDPFLLFFCATFQWSYVHCTQK